MDVKVHHDFSIVNLDEMNEIYSLVGWTKHTKENIKLVFDASNVFVFAMENGRLVGFGRAITDGVFNAVIYDVLVHPEFQKQGIARRMMEDILSQLSEVSCVHLISTTGKEDFYHKIGFKRMKTGMARYINPNLVSEYLE
ncbi:GNAT family N-acetyltransferase [Bacillus sp. 2205SS5-2]|uniref:GNAT family N-acetyltransferase n=1 Tax=Bacillus sp. 2205SS5-2 TaxID=3109031 RepID=UPI0030079AFB